jgi:type IV secretory pathway VirB3-like protein
MAVNAEHGNDNYTSTISFLKLERNATTSSHSFWDASTASIVAAQCPIRTQDLITSETTDFSGNAT